MKRKEIEQEFQKRGIDRIKVGGFDVDGVLRGKLISLDKFWSSFESGFGFCDVIFGWDVADVLYDNAKVTGWATGYPDATARMDPATLRFYRHEPRTAHILVDFHTTEGEPHPACPRNLLKSVIERCSTLGYRPKMSAEFEFWIFQEDSDSLEQKGFRDLTPLTPGMFGYSWLRTAQNPEIVHDILDTLHDYRVAIEGFHTETGPGVFEAALAYDDALEAADRAALFKTTVKQVVRRHGATATFMAKWNGKLPGASGHIHQSLWDMDGKKNLFADPSKEHGLSNLARHFVAGQVKLMPELTAIHSPFVNTYKRYVPGVWAPLTASWGVENRTCAVRVINASEAATRVEYRQTASDINPYTSMAACLGAGLYGIEAGIEPPPPVTGNATSPDAPGVALPNTLARATRLLAESDAARGALGEPFVDHYVRTRDWECRQYDLAVTDWELRRYFESV